MCPSLASRHRRNSTLFWWLPTYLLFVWARLWAGASVVSHSSTALQRHVHNTCARRVIGACVSTVALAENQISGLLTETKSKAVGPQGEANLLLSKNSQIWQSHSIREV